MHDTLQYLQAHPLDRGRMPEKITFSIHYTYNERYILPFSHDEVVHGKGTILNKLHGSLEDQFHQARLLYLYIMTHPGKQLNFMGNDLAMLREWDENREVDWHLTENADHTNFLLYITELNRLYCQTPALWTLDHSADGFKWVDNISDNPCVFGYTRTDGNQTVLVLLNFSDVCANLTLDQGMNVTLLLNTQDSNHESNALPHSILPYCGLLFKIENAN